MARTISGHPALNYGDPDLASAVVPGTKITLRTQKVALPLFLNLAKRLHKRVKPLDPKDTWSHGYRPPRAGSGISDHAGWAADFWASTIGTNTGTGPTSMTAQQARTMSEILEEFRTSDGEYIFGWGTRASNPGVTYGGQTYQRLSDPMHVFIAPGVTLEDLRDARKRLGIDVAGNRTKRTAA